MLKILYLYNATQTYTNTVFEHLACFAAHSRHKSFYCHHDPSTHFNVDLSHFDAVAIHYSIRLPYDQVSESTAKALAAFKGLKFLFIQDEYDHTHRAWHWIRTLGLQVVFSAVPPVAIHHVYPARELPDVRFINILTGYVPDDVCFNANVKKPSQRALIVGYRGRSLPIRYGQLGVEKIRIGEIVKHYCDANGIKNDIAWTEKSRIYGQRWYEFMGTCRAMLGVESGSNVFDWDGTLVERIAQFRSLSPHASNDEIYEKFVQIHEMDGIMNQVSPRIFEAIAAKTVLVLFEGHYSGVVKAGEHFISVKKDGSNLAEVFHLLQNGVYVDTMAERAYQEVIASGKYSYRSFVRLVDDEIEISMRVLECENNKFFSNHSDCVPVNNPTSITPFPIRANSPQPSTDTLFHTVSGADGFRDLTKRFATYMWLKLPQSVRLPLKPLLKQLLRKG